MTGLDERRLKELRKKIPAHPTGWEEEEEDEQGTEEES